jgi:uncharacterized membrane protein YjjP (DUF1212 family)
LLWSRVARRPGEQRARGEAGRGALDGSVHWNCAAETLVEPPPASVLGQHHVKTESPAIDIGLLLEFMSRLGQAYLACGEQTAEVELLLRRIGSVYGMSGSRAVAFPTALFIALHDGAEERVTLAEGPVQTLRLDQIADVYALGEAAQRGAVTLREGLDRIAGILRRTARFGAAGIIAGHTILTVGVAMVLVPVLTHIALAALLGVIVGAAKALNQRRRAAAAKAPAGH